MACNSKRLFGLSGYEQAAHRPAVKTVPTEADARCFK